MSRSRFLKLVATISMIALLGSGLWLLTSRSDTFSRLLVDWGLKRQTPTGSLVASGFVETEGLTVSSEYGGRIVALAADEGDLVEKGQFLLALDTTLLDAQIEAAAAAVAAARAQYEQIAAGPRPEHLQVAEAELARARAARDAAFQAWQDAILLRDNPQELEVEIAAARARLQVTEHQLAQAQALRDAAAVGYEGFEETLETIGPDQRVEIASGPLQMLLPLLQQILPPDLFQVVQSGADGTYSSGDYQVVLQDGHVTVYQKVGLQFGFHLLPNAYWQAGAAVNVARAAHDGARAALNHLVTVAEDPQAAQAQVDAAFSTYQSALAGVQVARTGLESLQAGAREEELALARAKVEQAQAALDGLQTRRARTRLHAPRGGIVIQRNASLGELAAPAAPLLRIADLSQVTLTVYVPLAELGRVQVGQVAQVRVDAFPKEIFRGTVIAIADKAEFTPAATQTQEERVNLVYAVEIRLPNPDGALKPGMPADATLDGLGSDGDGQP